MAHIVAFPTLAKCPRCGSTDPDNIEVTPNASRYRCKVDNYEWTEPN